MVETAVRRAAGGCYSRLGAHGAVTVRVNLGTDGRVTTSQVVQNGTGNQEVGRCISGAMVGQRFTAPRQGSLAFDIPFSG
jgi:TonB family protein